MPFSLSKAQKLQWKQQLKEYCITILEQRISAAEQAMKQAQEAANNEEKSSVGDKYETSRVMGQLDRDMNAKQSEEAKRDLVFIKSLPVTSLHDTVAKGSIVIIEDFMFFISLGLGSTIIDGHTIILLSPSAPVAALLNGKKTGDSFVFNKKSAEIEDVF